MQIHFPYLIVLADNFLVYGNSTGDIEIANTNLLEASTMYEEVPVTAAQSGGGGSTEHENMQTAGPTVSRAIPTTYGYATLEPNGMTVYIIKFWSDVRE
jgi:hypothetical protein